jgi:predicted nucleic acid-binding Zn ribbon protein
MDVQYEPGRHDPAAGPEPICVVCAARISEFDACCSLSCVKEAAREVQRNLAVLRQLRTPDAPSETRLRLAERNGRLSSALLRWRPSIDLTAAEPRTVQGT